MKSGLRGPLFRFETRAVVYKIIMPPEWKRGYAFDET